MVKKKISKSKDIKDVKTKTKKITSSKKDKISKVKVEEFTEDESNLIDKTFDLVKKLNTDVGKISKVKEKLQEDVKKLSNRVNSQNKISSTSQNNILVTLKEELIKEITPLLNKFDFKTVSVDIFKEISQILEIEIAKMRTEVSSKNTKVKKDFRKQFSQIEVRMIDALKSNEDIKNKFEKFEKTKVKSLFLDLEKIMMKTFENKNKEILSLFNSNSNNIEELKNQVENQKKEYSKINNNISRFKTDMKKLVSEDSTNLTSITSKIEKLGQEHSSINSLISSFEDKLYSQKSEISLSISEKFESDILKLKKLIKDLDLKQKGIEELVFTETKEVVKSEAIKAIKTDFNNYSNKLEIKFDKLKNVVNNSNQDVKESLKVINIEKEGQQEFLVSKYNDIVDKINEFENKISKKNKNDISELKNKFSKEIDSIFTKEFKVNKKNKENLIDNIDKKFSKINLDVSLSIKESIDKFNLEKEQVETKFNDIKTELLSLVKNYITEVDNEIVSIKKSYTEISEDRDIVLKSFNDKTNEISSRLDLALKTIESEKKVERDLVTSKINEVIDKFETLAIDNKMLFNEEKKNNQKYISKNIEVEFKTIKDEVARFKLQNQEFMKKLSDDNKDDKIKNSEIIENKISNSTAKFEDEIKDKIISFSTKIEEIEIKFDNDLKKQVEEKDLAIKDLLKFREEITEHTKKFIEEVDTEIKSIKTEENTFDSKKELAIGEFNEFISAKKIEIQDLEKQVEIQISDIIENERDKSDKNDENFKTLFNEKISNLIEVTNSKLNSFETKFIEKNISSVVEKIEEEKEVLSLINLELTSKAETVSKELEELDNKQKILHKDLMSEEIKLKERVEVKITELETGLSKKFLGIDSKFTNFKGVVIDEVEDLMSEVQIIVAEKISLFDKNMSKISFLSNETTNRINDFNRIAKGFEDEMINMRNEISDIRVKSDIMTPEIHSLNDHIHYMQTYEEQLIGVVRSLKERGLTNDSIQSALVTKGHPRFYVAMILKDFEVLFN